MRGKAELKKNFIDSGSRNKEVSKYKVEVSDKVTTRNVIKRKRNVTSNNQK